MNARELMLEDYVRVKGYHDPVMVTALDGYNNTVETEPCNDMDNGCLSKERGVEPIRISTEFLENLGFKDCGKAGWQRLPDCICYRHITFYFEEKTIFFGNPEISEERLAATRDIVSIHEFQQALRLNGCRELARLDYKIIK